MQIKSASKLSWESPLTALLVLKPYVVNPEFLSKIEVLFERFRDFAALSKAPVKVLLESEALKSAELESFLIDQVECKAGSVLVFRLAFTETGLVLAEEVAGKAKGGISQGYKPSPPVKEGEPPLDEKGGWVIDGEQLRLVVCFGGDGVVVHANRILQRISPAKPLRVPILGVNLGTLGFMSQFKADELDRALEAVFPDSTQTLGLMSLLQIPKIKFEVWNGGWLLL